MRVGAGCALKLLRKWLKVGGVEVEGQVVHPETGTPQGGTNSPVLANVSLHSALDRWFDKVVKAHCRGEALLCRYADDWVCALRDQEDAERCYRVLPQRLKQCNLPVAPEKTSWRRLSRFHPSMKRRVTFLGFAFAWMPDRHSIPRVRRRTARKKLQAACQRLTAWMKEHRHWPERDFCQRLTARLRGHDNADGVRGNSRALHRLCRWAMDCTDKGRHRRGGKRSSDTWEQCTRGLDRVKIARPCLREVKRRRVCACRLGLAPRMRVQPRNRMRENCTSRTVRGGRVTGIPTVEATTEQDGLMRYPILARSLPCAQT